MNLTEISNLDDMPMTKIAAMEYGKILDLYKRLCRTYIPPAWDIAQRSHQRVLLKLEKVLKKKRPIEKNDVVRLPDGRSGIVNRIEGDNASVFISPSKVGSIAIWFNISELKRIGRI